MVKPFHMSKNLISSPSQQNDERYSQIGTVFIEIWDKKFSSHSKPDKYLKSWYKHIMERLNKPSRRIFSFLSKIYFVWRSRVSLSPHPVDAIPDELGWNFLPVLWSPIFELNTKIFKRMTDDFVQTEATHQTLPHHQLVRSNINWRRTYDSVNL